jgi:tRNA-specific 2-thiouridylase
MFVVDIRPADRAVIIGPRAELLGRGLTARHMNWLVDAPSVGATVAVQVRHRAPTVAATIVRLDEAEIELALDEAVAAITPGQSLVLYDGERVLGGGVIERGKKELPVLAA